MLTDIVLQPLTLVPIRRRDMLRTVERVIGRRRNIGPVRFDVGEVQAPRPAVGLGLGIAVYKGYDWYKYPPGATPDQLAGLEHDLGRPLPVELRTWLAWHNGQSPDVAGAFVQSFHLLGASQTANVKKELDAQKPAGWHADWVPLLDDDNDNYVVLDAGGAVVGPPIRRSPAGWRQEYGH